MFSKAAIFATVSLALSVAAVSGDDKYKCNTGKAFCCNQTQQAEDVSNAKMLAIISALGQAATGLVGSNCSPITAVGVGGGTSCSQQPVCCENNHMNGVVVVGCTPINIGL